MGVDAGGEESVGRDYSIAYERQRVAEGEGAGAVADEAHERGEDGAAEDGHDDERAAELGVFAEALEADGEDGGEHDRHEEARDQDGPGAGEAGVGDAEGEQQDVDGGVEGEHARRRRGCA